MISKYKDILFAETNLSKNAIFLQFIEVKIQISSLTEKVK